MGSGYRLDSATQHGCTAHFIGKEQQMKFLRNFFSYLAQSDEYHEMKAQEAYLANAVDIHDLEYRMRELDRGGKAHPWATVTRG
jgi:Protein of unknown function (DUF3563)